jgi:excisionase family DNA binding protein
LSGPEVSHPSPAIQPTTTINFPRH